ncbi:glutamate racemase [Erythrobacter rubeus]|uniref:Glutamate racemase n=1 Tax=Erythrobacter rubeus TaxID=2760803 RepID=A0ABR8KV20_9SPHN|nr:glutamate racemase [Erythrobacter rubeus]
MGGLTVLGELRRILPEAPVIYAADLAGLPYGTKTEAEVAARVCGLLGRMAERHRPRLICIACNTASTIALGMVRDVLEIPIVGTVPAIKPAAMMTRSGVIGLLGTAATVRQPYVDRLEAEFAADKLLIRAAAPGLVEMAEAKSAGATIDITAVRQEVAGLLKSERGKEIDTVVLACTHFPLLEQELSEVFGPGVNFIHGAQGIARRIAALTQGQSFERSGDDVAVITSSSGSAELGSVPALLEEYGLHQVRVF